MVSGRSVLGGIHLVRPGERKTAGKKRTEGERDGASQLMCLKASQKERVREASGEKAAHISIPANFPFKLPAGSPFGSTSCPAQPPLLLALPLPLLSLSLPLYRGFALPSLGSCPPFSQNPPVSSRVRGPTRHAAVSVM